MSNKKTNAKIPLNRPRSPSRHRNSHTARSNSNWRPKIGWTPLIFLTITLSVISLLFLYILKMYKNGYLFHSVEPSPFLYRFQTPNSSEANLRSYTDKSSNHETSSSVLSKNFNSSSAYYREIAQDVELLKQHPLNSKRGQKLQADELNIVMEYIYKQKGCAGKPLFTTMANVISDLYWQMIENFMYTLIKYGHITCSLMICVSDANCMKKCEDSNFPCYNYDFKRYHQGVNEPSPLEQIAELKLFRMTSALANGVDIFVVDLDVGFLSDPMELLKLYKSKTNIDIFVQEDISFVMDRSEKGWRTWYTVPLPNIGLFLCRGNAKTAKMFQIAWEDYQTMNPSIKHNPGKDQNKVVNAMMKMKREFGLQWKYFPKTAAVLLDKIYKFKEQTYELGGLAAYESLNPEEVIAAHTTCYEQKVKVTGLKAVNAFWNPIYYNPMRRTLTKKLLYTGPATNDLIDEIRSLIYLAIASNRSLILPNVLGDDKIIQEAVQFYKGHPLWPGFRLVYFREHVRDFHVDILEPGYYWRIRTGSTYGELVPEPVVLCVPKPSTLADVEHQLLSHGYHSANRVILDTGDSSLCLSEKSIISWADDSVGRYDDYSVEINGYDFLPSIKGSLIRGNSKILYSQLGSNIVQSTRLCKGIFEAMKGNRSCFDKCD